MASLTLRNNKKWGWRWTNRFLLSIVSTSILLLLAFCFWNQLALSISPWRVILRQHVSDKFLHLRFREYSVYTDDHRIQSNYVPRGRMRALSFVGYSEEPGKTSMVSFKLGVAPDSSTASRFSSIDVTQIDEYGVGNSPLVVPNQQTLLWSGESPEQPARNGVRHPRENQAGGATPSSNSGSHSMQGFEFVSVENQPMPLVPIVVKFLLRGVTRAHPGQFVDGEGLRDLSRSTAYTEQEDSASILEENSGWFSGDEHVGGKPLQFQHRELDDLWQEELARDWEKELDELDDNGEFEDTGMSHRFTDVDIEENWPKWKAVQNQDYEATHSPDFVPLYIFRFPNEASESTAVEGLYDMEGDEEDVDDEEDAMDDEEDDVEDEEEWLDEEGEDVAGEETDFPGGGPENDDESEGAFVDDEDYEDYEDEDVEEDGDGATNEDIDGVQEMDGTDGTGDASTSEYVGGESVSASGEYVGEAEDFPEAELAWVVTRGEGVSGGSGGTNTVTDGDHVGTWRGWLREVSDTATGAFYLLNKWWLEGATTEVPPAQPLMWMGRNVELGGVAL